MAAPPYEKAEFDFNDNARKVMNKLWLDEYFNREQHETINNWRKDRGLPPLPYLPYNPKPEPSPQLPEELQGPPTPEKILSERLEKEKKEREDREREELREALERELQKPRIPPKSMPQTMSSVNYTDDVNTYYAKMRTDPNLMVACLIEEVEEETVVNTSALVSGNALITALIEAYDSIIEEMDSETYNILLYEGPSNLASEILMATLPNLLTLAGENPLNKDNFNTMISSVMQSITMLTLIRPEAE